MFCERYNFALDNSITIALDSFFFGMQFFKSPESFSQDLVDHIFCRMVKQFGSRRNNSQEGGYI